MRALEENYLKIRENIASAAKKSGRNADDIQLIAVTKTIAPEVINSLLTLGVDNFGENKAQELASKYEFFEEKKPSWHMIGHLQTNKVKYVIDKVKMIQSLDSVRLAEEINSRAEQKGVIMDALIEVNTANEDTKCGIEPNRLDFFIEHMQQFANIRLRGLMCIAPFVKNPDDNRVFFQKMLKFFLDIKQKYNYYNYIDYLSMGMSNDYSAAIEEGANMVRIGTAFFGNRN